MPQLSYDYQMPKGTAGSRYDLSPYSIFSRVNGETDDAKMKFGMGVMVGENPGTDVLVPTTGMTADQFEGVLMTGYTQEMDSSGAIKCKSRQTVGVLRFGTAWARVVEDVDPVYGEQVYLITEGDSAGLFTNDDTSPNLEVSAKFLGGLGTGAVAPIELFRV